MSRGSDYISIARQNVRDFWEAYETLKSMQDEWNAQNYGSTLADGIDANAGITAASVGAVVFDTINAIKTVMDAGSATNITKLL